MGKVEDLIAQLESDDANVKSSALLSLRHSRVCPAKAIVAAAKLLADSDPVVQEWACRLMEERGKRALPAAEQILISLNKVETSNLFRLLLALSKMGKPVITLLLKASKDGLISNSDVQAVVGHIVRSTGPIQNGVKKTPPPVLKRLVCSRAAVR